MLDSDQRLRDFMVSFREGSPPSIREFEEILREAGAPKSVARRIATQGYAKAILELKDAVATFNAREKGEDDDEDNDSA